MWRFLLLFAWHALVVTFRRLLVGPRRPRWTWLLEALQPTMLGLARWGAHLPLPQIRAQIDQAAGQGQQLPGVQTIPEAVGTMHAEWFLPSDDDDLPVVLYLHGGAYTCCSINTHRGLISRLAWEARAKVLALEYRLAPEHPYPAALDDAVEAYRWLLAEGHALSRLVVAGDSAGGGLALALLLRLRDEGVPLPACAYFLSPWTDLACTGPSLQANNGFDYLPAEAVTLTAQHYVGQHDPRTPGISPLYGSFRGLPPLLLQAGGAEIILDDSRRVAERARNDGVQVELQIWEDMVHVFQAFGPAAPDSKQALEHAAQFIRTHAVGNAQEKPEERAAQPA